MKIEILGPGCQNCQILANRAVAAAAKLGIEFELVKVTDLSRIAEFGVMVTPALVLDGKVKASGKVLSESEITTIMNSEIDT